MSWETVYILVKKIPRGRVTTYGELARALRLSGGARAVGYAMAACPAAAAFPGIAWWALGDVCSSESRMLRCSAACLKVKASRSTAARST